jgi:hypothetical protein
MMKMSHVAAIASMAAILGAPVAHSQDAVWGSLYGDDPNVPYGMSKMVEGMGLQPASERVSKPTWDEYYVYWLDAGYGATTLQWTAAEQANMLMWDDAEAYQPAASRQMSAAERENMRVFELNNSYSVDVALGAGSADWATSVSQSKALVWTRDYVYWLDAAPGGALLWRAGAVWDGYYVPAARAIAQNEERSRDEDYAYFLDSLPSGAVTQADLMWNLDSTYGFATAAHEDAHLGSTIWDEDMAFLPTAAERAASNEGTRDNGNLIRTSVQH